MPRIIVRHGVQDYSNWRQAFDGHASAREEYGLREEAVLRDADDPNMLTVIMSAQSIDRAREFAGSDSLREAMQNAGVTSAPMMIFANEA